MKMHQSLFWYVAIDDYSQPSSLWEILKHNKRHGESKYKFRSWETKKVCQKYEDF